MQLLISLFFLLLTNTSQAANILVIETDKGFNVYIDDKGGMDFFNSIGTGDKGNVRVGDFLKGLMYGKA